ncbi:MAG: triose-phosphate isomerase [Candidatus Micrarchaeota archaeon]
MKPLIALNFKTTGNLTKSKILELSKIAEDVARETGANIAIAPPQLFAAFIASQVNIPVFAQHVDANKPGSNTGSVTAEQIKEAGAIGSLLNHSEKRLTPELVKATVERCREVGIQSLVCTANPKESQDYSKFNPTFIAVEPPELIGSGISVSSAKPEVVTNSVALVREVSQSVIILCGAGVSNGSDVKKAIELGSQGVLLASAFTKAKDPKAVLLDMAKATV